jgi:hypothetical protein
VFTEKGCPSDGGRCESYLKASYEVLAPVLEHFRECRSGAVMGAVAVATDQNQSRLDDLGDLLGRESLGGDKLVQERRNDGVGGNGLPKD